MLYSTSIHLSVSAAVCLWVCLCISLCVHLFVCVSVCLSVCVRVCVCVHLSVYVSVCLWVHLSVCMSICLSNDASVCDLGIRSQSKPHDIMHEVYRAMKTLGYVSVISVSCVCLRVIFVNSIWWILVPLCMALEETEFHFDMKPQNKALLQQALESHNRPNPFTGQMA